MIALRDAFYKLEATTELLSSMAMGVFLFPLDSFRPVRAPVLAPAAWNPLLPKLR